MGDESPIGMYGYSGGAIVTGHAAELKQSYAPELNIVGAAEGGVPADLEMPVGATTPLQWAAYIGAVNATIVERALNPSITGEEIVATMRTLLRPGIVG